MNFYSKLKLILDKILNITNIFISGYIIYTQLSNFFSSFDSLLITDLSNIFHLICLLLLIFKAYNSFIHKNEVPCIS